MEHLAKFRKSLAVLPLAIMSAGAMAADLDAATLTAGITEARAIIIAVGVAIFSLVGLIVAIHYSRKSAGDYGEYTDEEYKQMLDSYENHLIDNWDNPDYDWENDGDDDEDER